MARIALCQDVSVEYMGYASIGTVLRRAGHAVEIFLDDGANEDRFLADLAAYRPDIVGFSILTPSVPWALRVGRRVKDALGAITAFGNIHAVTNPEIIEDAAVDILCRSEGEQPMLELAGCVDDGRPFETIRGFWVKTGRGVTRNANPDELVDLDALPFLDWSLYDKYPFFRSRRYLRVMLGRGCPFRCSFCANAILVDHHGGMRYVRKVAPQRAIEELEFQVRQREVKVVFFLDEVFWVKNGWLREFLRLYKTRIGLPFSANFRFGGGLTEADVRLMADAGAKRLIVSTETADEQQRRQLMNKPVRDAQIIQVTEWLRKYRIDYACSAFFGLPGDTVQDHVDRLEFFRTIKPTYLWTTFFQPYPGVALTREAFVQRFMPADQAFEATLHHDMYLDLPDRDHLVNLKKVYWLCVLSRTLTPWLVWLTRFRIPLLFDVLFMVHFAYYVLKFERPSLRQFLSHLRVFAIKPLRRAGRSLHSTGAPYGIGQRPRARGEAAPSDRDGGVVGEASAIA